MSADTPATLVTGHPFYWSTCNLAPWSTLYRAHQIAFKLTYGDRPPSSTGPPVTIATGHPVNLVHLCPAAGPTHGGATMLHPHISMAAGPPATIDTGHPDKPGPPVPQQLGPPRRVQHHVPPGGSNMLQIHIGWYTTMSYWATHCPKHRPPSQPGPPVPIAWSKLVQNFVRNPDFFKIAKITHEIGFFGTF